MTDSWAKQEKKTAAPKNDASYDAIVPLAGKFLKARSNEEREALLLDIEPLAQKVNKESLSGKLNDAIANKDVLAGLLTLKYIGVSSPEEKAFLAKSLGMKNASIKLEAINLSVSNAELLIENKTLLEGILAEEKSPFIKEILEKALL